MEALGLEEEEEERGLIKDLTRRARLLREEESV